MLWRGWLLRAIAGDPQDLQIMYAVDGARDLPERELDHLPGYAGSRPVRVGNGAVDQRQSDVLGEVMLALGAARDATADRRRTSWALQRTLVNELAKNWQRPDHGLWEIRGPQRHFTHSRVMVWVAFDEAVRGGRAARPATARSTCGARSATRCAPRSWRWASTPSRNTFVQHYDTDRGRRRAAPDPRWSGFCPATTRACSARSKPSSAT